MTSADSSGIDGIEHVTKPRRRYVLECLSESDVPLALADLARDVAAKEAETTVRDVDHDAVERVYLSLYHCDVPKLADAGLVDYRRDRKTVELSERDASAETALPGIDSGSLRHRA